MLDDIFDKLDAQRVGQILELVQEKNFGQLFLTDTHLERTKSLVQERVPSHKIISF